jgi:hypothetical protein
MAGEGSSERRKDGLVRLSIVDQLQKRAIAVEEVNGGRVLEIAG